MSTRSELENAMRRRWRSYTDYRFDDELAKHRPLKRIEPAGLQDEKCMLDQVITYYLDKADGFPAHRTALCRLLGLPTPEEKSIEDGDRSASAAEQTVQIAEEANDIARKANKIAEDANRKSDEGNVIAERSNRIESRWDQ